MQKDINKILEITKAGAWAIPKIGIYPWNGSYLSKVVFLKNWKQNELYVTELRGNLELVGLFLSPWIRHLTRDLDQTN